MDCNISFNNLSKNTKLRLYIENMATLFNADAVFSDGTKEFRNPPEPKAGEEVVLSIRTAKDNVDSVYLHSGDSTYEMIKSSSDEMFDYYSIGVVMPQEIFIYYFELKSGKRTCFYNHIGVCTNPNPDYNFVITPGFSTPEWAKGAVIYQIFVDRFCNGDPSNDVEDNEYIYIGQGTRKAKNWNQYPKELDVREFYGGDLQGVWDKLDYLQNLGVEVIYLNPIFVSPSNHKYDIQDYDYVDPHYGKIVKDEGELLEPDATDNKEASRYMCRVTDKANLEASNRFFAEFVEEVHKRGMKVILDGVFNHCGSFNKWLDRECIYEDKEGYEPGAYVSEDSPYHTFFKFFEEDKWPYNHTYDGWWGNDTLPKLNYEDSPKLFDYIMRIARKWVSEPYNVDGWRLDVAADVGHSQEFNHHFWKEFRRNVKEANPEAIILAEHYGDPISWLKGDEWDTVMNYDAFMEPLTWFLTGVDKHSDEFRGDLLGNTEAFVGAMRHHMTRFQTPSLQVAMNELSNHDHSRFLTRTSHKVGRIATNGPEDANQGVNKGVMRMAVMMQMTWPGAPTVYYGDEAGLCGWTDPDNRRSYPWGHEDKELILFHKEMIRIHRDYQALKTGSLIYLRMEHEFICYGRMDKEDKFIILINLRGVENTVDIPAWKVGVYDGVQMGKMMTTTQEGFSLEAGLFRIEQGMLRITCPPVSGIVLKTIRNPK